MSKSERKSILPGEPSHGYEFGGPSVSHESSFACIIMLTALQYWRFCYLIWTSLGLLPLRIPLQRRFRVSCAFNLTPKEPHISEVER